MYVTVRFLKLYKNINPRRSVKAATNAGDKGKLYRICSMPEISDRKFCDSLEMKFT